MIGQRDIQSKIRKQIENKTLPRFIILVGTKGSGKRMLSQSIANWLHAIPYTCDIKVSAVRDMIATAYKVANPVVYIIADADSMSNEAKNALLKVTEEPPRNAYFILTLQDENNTLNTIRSRGTVFHMDNYTPDELHDYAIQRYVGKLNAQELDIIMDLCENPFEVQMICDYGVIEFWEYVLKVVDNVHLVSGSNSFKIGDRIAFKEDEKGKINLKLFWKAFMTVCANRLTEDPLKYSQGVKITSKYLQELRIVGINRVSTFDMWLLEIREYWMED